MGINAWWDRDQVTKANQFLATGQLSDVVMNAPLNNDPTDPGSSDFSKLGGCSGSYECPAGYACVQGVCTRMGPNPPSIQSSAGAGDCDQENPNSPCNKGGPGSCSQTPNCGDIPEPRPDDCCGKKRCCRFGGLSSSFGGGVQCFCGDCPELSKCNDFCSAYVSANGEEGAGCKSGSSGNSCDECSYCQFGQCQPLPLAPCHCNGGQSCNTGGCEKCQIDRDEPFFGSCTSSLLDGCQICTSISNYKCPCNKVIGSTTACTPAGQGFGSSASLAGRKVAKTCAVICDNPCTDVSKGTLPEECKDCDCNCHNDCGECEICGSDGTCQPDPTCTTNQVSTWSITSGSVTTSGFAPTEDNPCAIGQPNTGGGGTTTYTSGCGPLPHTLVETSECDFAIGVTTNEDGCTVYTTNEDHGFFVVLPGWNIVDGNGNVIGQFNGPDPVGWRGGAASFGNAGCSYPSLTNLTPC